MAEDQDLDVVAQRFSDEAFEVAKAFVAGGDSDELRARAEKLADRLPELGARVQALPAGGERAGVERLLSEALLDIRYVRLGGAGASSIRLFHVMRESAG
jgi:acetyl esterase/lipase